MIFGSIRVENDKIITHRKTFVLSLLTNWDVVQPFWTPARILGAAFTGFIAAFADLMYPIEIALVLGVSAVSIISGWQIALLRLNGPSLRGTDQGQALWGRYVSLQEKRAEIDAAKPQSGTGESE